MVRRVLVDLGSTLSVLGSIIWHHNRLVCRHSSTPSSILSNLCINSPNNCHIRCDMH